MNTLVKGKKKILRGNLSRAIYSARVLDATTYGRTKLFLSGTAI